MNPKTINQFLARHRKIGIDTCIFVYWGENSEKYGELVDPIFTWLEGRGRAVTSTVTMLELLVQPYRLNDIDRVNQLYSLFSTFPNLHWLEPSLDLADRAAHLRGTLHLKTRTRCKPPQLSQPGQQASFPTILHSRESLTWMC